MFIDCGLTRSARSGFIFGVYPLIVEVQVAKRWQLDDSGNRVVPGSRLASSNDSQFVAQFKCAQHPSSIAWQKKKLRLWSFKWIFTENSTKIPFSSSFSLIFLRHPPSTFAPKRWPFINAASLSASSCNTLRLLHSRDVRRGEGEQKNAVYW